VRRECCIEKKKGLCVYVREERVILNQECLVYEEMHTNPLFFWPRALE
jgi:hypothetical protein